MTAPGESGAAGPEVVPHAWSAYERRVAITVLCSELAHELAPALAFLRDLLQSSGLGDAERSVAEEEVARLAGLLAALRRTRRVEDAWGPVQLASAARRAADRVRAELGTGSDVVVEVPEDLVVDGTPYGVELALVSLLRNAIAASGGRPVSVVGRQEATGRAVEVEDTGSGFPPELEERLFQPLSTLGVAGSGTGLAVVMRVAREHAADFDVRRDGPRTICRLHFPTTDAFGHRT